MPILAPAKDVREVVRAIANRRDGAPHVCGIRASCPRLRHLTMERDAANDCLDAILVRPFE